MAGRNYSDQHRQEVLSVLKSVGLSEASRRTGVAKSTLLVWARDADIDTAMVSEQVTQQRERATRASNARQMQERAERRERISARLYLAVEATLLRINQVLQIDGAFGSDDVAALSQLLDRAMKQLALLEGRPSERVDLVEGQVLSGLVEAVRRGLLLIEDEQLRQTITDAIAFELHQIGTEQREGSTFLGEAVEDAEYAELEPGEAAA
jgi:transposase